MPARAANLECMRDDLAPRLNLACSAAREAGKLTLRYFQQSNLAVDLKHDATPVTVADREAEQLLRKRIAAEFPADGILGEEFGEQAGTSGYRWVLDPVDGTKSFIHGVPMYGVLIGIEKISGNLEDNPRDTSQIGVIYIPVLDEMVYAAAGQGAWYTRGNGAPQPALVSKTPRIAEALFCTSSVSGFHKRGAWQMLERLATTAKITRTWGDAYGYMLVATGRADLMIDPVMNLWDAAPLVPILQEAGGTFTDWQGRATIYGGEGIATNGLLLDEVLRSMTS